MWECEPFNLVLNITLSAPRFSSKTASIPGRLMHLAHRRRSMPLEEALQATLDGAVLLALLVQPGAAQASLVGVDPWRSRLVIRLKARAQAGQANRALCAQLAAWLACPSTSISIVEGHTSRQKRVRVEGMRVETVVVRLSALMHADAEGDAHP